MKKILSLVLTVCMLTVLAGTALADGKLVLYASTPEEFLNVVVEEYTKATGVEVEIVSAGTGELYKRVEAEGDNPLGDVFLGGMVSSGYVPKIELWEPYVSPLDTELPEAFRNTTGKVTSFSMVPTAIMLNTEGLAGVGAEVTGFEERLNPALKGKIVMPDPTSTSSGWEALVNILYAMGGGDTEEGWAFVDKLLANISGKVLTSSSAVHKGCAGGEYAAALIAESMADTYINQGLPVSRVFMKEGVVVNVDGVAIIKGAKNLENAQKFVDFLISKDFQQIMVGLELPRRPVRTDIDMSASKMIPTEEINQIPVDFDYVAAHKAEMQEHFKEIAINYAE